jgi:hypothetical protein
VIPDQYVVIWFDGPSAYTLVDSSNKPVYVSLDEVLNDLEGLLVDREEVEEAQYAGDPTKRYGILVEHLEMYLGIYL